jgi:hypothetical protein
VEKGVIYVMTTVVQGLIKIGQTTNFESRMNELERNGYYNVPGLKRKFAIEVEDFVEKEQLVHRLFSKSQVGQSELFSLDTEEVIQLLSSFKGRIIYPENTTNESIFAETTELIQVKEKVIPDGYYTMQVKGTLVNATMQVQNGQIILKKGSVIAPSQEYSRQVPLVENTITADFLCSSPSTAASIVAGNNRNGWLSWKDDKDNFIDVYRKKVVAEHE